PGGILCPDGDQLAGHRLDEQVDREQGFRVPFTPTIYLPPGTQELDVRVCRKVDKNLVGTTIEFLWKSNQRFGDPIRSVGRALDRDIDALLLDNPCDSEGENQRLSLLVANTDFRPRPSFADGSFRQ